MKLTRHFPSHPVTSIIPPLPAEPATVWAPPSSQLECFPWILPFDTWKWNFQDFTEQYVCNEKKLRWVLEGWELRAGTLEPGEGGWIGVEWIWESRSLIFEFYFSGIFEDFEVQWCSECLCGLNVLAELGRSDRHRGAIGGGLATPAVASSTR